MEGTRIRTEPRQRCGQEKKTRPGGWKGKKKESRPQGEKGEKGIREKRKTTRVEGRSTLTPDHRDKGRARREKRQPLCKGEGKQNGNKEKNEFCRRKKKPNHSQALVKVGGGGNQARMKREESKKSGEVKLLAYLRRGSKESSKKSCRRGKGPPKEKG